MMRSVLALAAAVVLAHAEYSGGELTIPHGLEDPFAFSLSMRGSSAFRLRIYNPKSPSPFESPMIAPVRSDTKYEVINDKEGMGIRSSLGTIMVTKKGTIVLKDLSGAVLTETKPMSPGQPLMLSSNGGKLYGRGAAPPDARQLTATASDPLVCNRATYTPYYYSTDGYSALGVVNTTDGATVGHLPARYQSSGQDISWYFSDSFELYIMPAKTLAEGTRAYYQLIGAPQVLPRYAFGFSASRWGWQDKAYIDDTLQKFRSGKFPIDGIIVDFEWFTNESDYSFQPPGKSYYNDFGFNPVTFPHPKEQLASYKEDLHIRMAGIRKPRLGNTDFLNMARSKGWILPNGEPSGGFPPDIPNSYAVQRNLDYSIPEVRKWYSEQLAGLVEDGVSFWWNDEGETNYFTYHWWNVAELDALRSKDPNRRFYSLNRGWTPGMARMGAAAWTGDVDSTWEDLKSTPGMMLNWVLGGAPYVAADIGGFLGNTSSVHLTRWIQIGVFMPIMRVHSVIDAIPHFPWLWGDDAAAAIRKALELRYRLIPYHYSLAHAQYKTQNLWIRPLVMEFPDDPLVADITTQWMDGDILVAPIVEENNLRDIYLPQGQWYLLAPDATATLLLGGGRRLGKDGSLDEMPAFVRPGTVLPLAPVVQHTDALPGGPLEVQVYAGKDGSFVLVEDDGETLGYTAGQTRNTHLKWDEASKTLSWTVDGAKHAAGKHAFTEVTLTVFDESGIYRSSNSKTLGSQGSIAMGPDSIFF